jgi:cytochrome c
MRGLAKAGLVIGAIVATASLAACSGGAEKSKTTTTNTTTTSTTTANTTAAAPPAADSTDTLSGATLAQFTGDAAAGQAIFAQCQACHTVVAGQNRIGPSLHAIVGRRAGTVAGFNYTPANRDSGITWTPEKLFQYLENPQRVVPGTRMAFAGIADPQRRANLIAWLGTQR